MTWAIDAEIYSNYFLFGGKNVETGEVISFESRNGSRFNRRAMERFILENRTVGFNTIKFDLIIIYMAIHGYASEKLKRVANKIIVGKEAHWKIAKALGITIPRDLDHIDLIDIVPGQYSLKMYGGRLHTVKMQDLPYDPDMVLTEGQMDEVYEYWLNDLDVTIALHQRFLTQIALREYMTRQYKTDLMSKSDAQIAEAVLKHEIEKLTGRTPYKPEIAPGTKYRYKFPDFISFYSDEMMAVVDAVYDAEFEVSEKGSIKMPKELAKLKIKIGDSTYKLGIGGLHSTESKVSHRAGNGVILRDADVTSYYPYIILSCGLYPKHLGKAFLTAYRAIVERRVSIKSESKALYAKIADMAKERGSDDPKIVRFKREAKKLEDDSSSLKIVANGSFGKLGNKYSCLYSPDLMIQVTITGQLSLLMLIERLERKGIKVVSANTDGIVAKFSKDQETLYNRICDRWQKETGFGLEFADYKALYSRDVNSYFAIKPDGKVKRKGAYAEPEPMGSGWPSPANEIVVKAVIDFLSNGVPIEDTIYDCRDIRQFLSMRTVKGGALDADGDFIGKAIRWYYAEGVEGCITYASNGNKVPRTDGAKPCMQFPKRFPKDVNFEWYVAEAKSILKDIGWKPDRSFISDFC